MLTTLLGVLVAAGDAKMRSGQTYRFGVQVVRS